MTALPTVRRPRLFWLAVALVAALGAAMLFVLWGVVGLYVFGRDSGALRLLATVLPLPVAEVNGEFVSYTEWSDDTRAFVELAERGKLSIPGATSRHQIAKNVMDRLVRNRLLETLAARRGIVISDAEVSAEFRAAINAPDDRRQLQAILAELHWSDRDVKEQIIRPYLIGRRLAERLGSVAAAEQAVSDELAKASIKIFVKF